MPERFVSLGATLYIMSKEAKKIGPLQRRALIEPTSVNAESRTFTVAFASESPVLMSSWWDDDYYEVLGMEGMRTARLDSGAPLLDNHSRYGSVAENVIGVVKRHWREGQTAYAEIQLSAREQLAGLLQDIKDGIIRNISCGYRVYAYAETSRKDADKIPTYRATDWEPFEVSLVPIGADPKASVRSQGDEAKNEVSFSYSSQRTMPQNEETPATPVAPVASPAPVAPSVDVEQQRALAAQEAVAAERKRAADIKQAVRALKLGDEFADKLISEGVSVDTARQRAIEEWEKGGPKGPTVHGHVQEDEGDKYRTLAIAALSHRSGKIDRKQFSQDELGSINQFRGVSLLDLAKRSLEKQGINYQGLNKMELVARAITSSMGDLPVILEGTARRVLLANYGIIADSWRRFCAVGSVSDFREYTRLRWGSIARLDKLVEGSEYKTRKIPDAEKEKIKAETFGNTINLSRQMIINDDLNAFTSLAAMLGRAAARSIEIDVFAMLAQNGGLGPVMNDGNTLFHADHNNIYTASYPTVEVFDGMAQLMAQQKDPSDNDFLDLRPSIGLFPTSLRGVARVINDAEYDPDATGQLKRPNISRGLLSDIVDTPRMTGTRYYMLAPVSEAPTFEVVFLDGVQEPYMESMLGFHVDGVEWKVRHDYGMAPVDWRSAVTNAGAEPE